MCERGEYTLISKQAESLERLTLSVCPENEARKQAQKALHVFLMYAAKSLDRVDVRLVVGVPGA